MKSVQKTELKYLSSIQWKKILKFDLLKPPYGCFHYNIQHGFSITRHLLELMQKIDSNAV